MKKLFLCLIITTFMVGCNKENSKDNNINNSQTKVSNEVTQGEWSADGINVKTGTIFNEAGDTKYLKVADLDNKFSTNTEAIYCKIPSPNKDKRIIWASTFMEHKIQNTFPKWKQEVEKTNKDEKLLQSIENSLPNMTTMDLLLETEGNKLINQGIRFAFFSDTQFNKINEMIVNINGKNFLLKNPGVVTLPRTIIKPHFFNIVITPVTPDLINELTKVKANGDIFFTIKANGFEKRYVYKNIMDSNAGIYPLLMKANQGMKQN